MSDRIPDQCLVCRFYKPFWIGEEDSKDRRQQTFGRCRRRPPVTVAWPEPQSERGYDADTVWPTVDQSDWCGEFERAEEPFL